LFFKRKNRELKENLPQDRLAGKIARFGIMAQTKFAETMNRAFGSLSPKGRRNVLVLFCLFWGGLSGYYLFTAILKPGQSSLKVESINVPRHINQGANEEDEYQVGQETYEKVQEYKKDMDSTHQRIEPGLLDSINILEQIYLSQTNKEAYEK
jgi:hypothetical protein